MAAEWPLAGAPRAAAVVAAVTLVAVVAAFSSGLPDRFQWLAGLAGAAVGLRGVIRLARPRVVTLSVDERGLAVKDASGQYRSGSIVSAFVSPMFVGLRWRAERGHGPRTLGIFSEQMAADDFRRLSAALRREREA